MAFGRRARKKALKTPSKRRRARGPGFLTMITDPRTVLRVVTTIRVAGPVVTAGAMKAATSLRGKLDESRSRQLGVPVEALVDYQGPTGPARARIAGLYGAIGDLRARRGTEENVARFARSADVRLADLTAAVDATVSMPPPTRRVALQAISADLDQVDADLMTFLVGPPVATMS